MQINVTNKIHFKNNFMKKLNNLWSLLGLAILLGSCSADPYFPEDDSLVVGQNSTIECNGSDAISAMPSSFTQKVLLEEATGAWCQWCPIGIACMDSLINFGYDETTHQYKVIGVAIHKDDGMETDFTSYYVSKFGIASYPTILLDRQETLPTSESKSIHENAADWHTPIEARLAETAVAGLAIETNYTDSVNYTTADVKVYVGGTSAVTGDYKLHVYLYQDEVKGTGAGFDQVNALSGKDLFKDTEFYAAEGKIKKYPHAHVVRGTATAPDGEAITSSEINGKNIEKSFSLDLVNGFETESIKASAPTSNKTYIVAFLTNTDGTEVINVQKVKLGCIQDWD